MQISISDHFLPFFREGGNNTTFMCEICAKNFGMKHNLEQHVKTVHGTASLQCEHCNRAFKRKFPDTTSEDMPPTGGRVSNDLHCSFTVFQKITFLPKIL